MCSPIDCVCSPDAQRTLKLIVEYDGTDFCGYQAQARGERTVQSVLQNAIEEIMPGTVVLHAAGRTDTGVHALGQVVSFATASDIPIARVAIALNSRLPRDIAIASASEMPEGFDARHSAKSRTYAYLIWTRRTRSALWGRYSLHVRRALDVASMREAAQHLVGTHDFAAFAKSGGDPGPTTVRDLTRLAVRRRADGTILLTVTANGFLRSMVRSIVGALLEVGYGDLTLPAIAEILATRDRTLNRCPAASPQGLCLLRVDY